MFGLLSGHSFDVASLLGIGTPSSEPLPFAKPGDAILRVSEDIYFETLVRNDWIRKKMILVPNGSHLGNRVPVRAGVHLLKLREPNSCGKTYVEQLSLQEGREGDVASATLVAMGILCLRAGGADSFRQGGFRCVWNENEVAFVTWSFGRLWIVTDEALADYRGASVWLASALTL